jgi:hypothetical protein
MSDALYEALAELETAATELVKTAKPVSGTDAWVVSKQAMDRLRVALIELTQEYERE